MRISTLLTATAAVGATAAAGSAVTTPAVRSAWYRRLRKPGYQPPSAAFPVVWPALYADIAAVSAYSIDELHEQGETAAAQRYRVALILNLVFNAGWSWLFFGRRRLGTAAMTALALTASGADLTRRAIEAGGRRGALLAPYPAWCGFATALSTHIWWLNRGRSRRS